MIWIRIFQMLQSWYKDGFSAILWGNKFQTFMITTVLYDIYFSPINLFVGECLSLLGILVYNGLSRGMDFLFLWQMVFLTVFHLQSCLSLVCPPTSKPVQIQEHVIVTCHNKQQIIMHMHVYSGLLKMFYT